jgi:hypothetical protein
MTETQVNKSAIMRSAWQTYRTVRYECERRALAKGYIPARFQNALRAAWAEAKRAAAARPHTADEIRARITAIECSTDFLTAADRAEIEALRNELRGLEPSSAERTLTAAEMRERIGARLRQMRDGTMTGLSRENWRELGALRHTLRADFSTSV